jgi:diguanylate cyclase (GGDEF)-like protein
MSGIEEHLSSSNRRQRWWLGLSVALLLGLAIFVSINIVVTGQPMAALLSVCSMALIGISFVLYRQLHLARSQRDEALALVSTKQWPTCEGLCHLESSLAECAARRIQVLQAEIADLQGREQRLKVQAHHDGLTGLANRFLLTDRFQLTVERAKRSGNSFALLMVDLNDFKAINDHHGHVAGDEVLVITAQRLLGAVRASDTVARIGGDEFVLIIESIEDPLEMRRIGEKLFDMLTDPITLSTGVVEKLGASIGLALYPNDGDSLNDLLHVADQAMYECKSTGFMSLH